MWEGYASKGDAFTKIIRTPNLCYIKNMIWTYNILLIFIGVPLFGFSLCIFTLFIPEGRDMFTPMYVVLWVVFLIPFILVYKKRANWLRSKGIYRSWRYYKSYLYEKHDSPVISLEKKIEFINWIILNCEKSKYHVTHCKKIYNQINNTYHQKNDIKDKLDCLSWYYYEQPFDDEEYLDFLMNTP